MSLKKNLLLGGGAFLVALSLSLPTNAFQPGDLIKPIIICEKAENLVDAVKLRDAGADSEGLEIVHALLQRGQCVQNIFGLPMEVSKLIYDGKKDTSVYEILDPTAKNVVYYTLGESPKGQIWNIPLKQEPYIMWVATEMDLVKPAEVRRTSPLSGVTHSMVLPISSQKQIVAWESGEFLVQEDVFPDLSPEEREFIILTGITPAARAAIFPDE